MSGGSLNWIPGALRSQQLSISASRHLSFSASQLLSISVLVSWESLAEVSKGRKVPRVEKKVFCLVSRGRCRSLSAPSTFLLLCPYAPKLAAIARYCRRSFRRALDEVVAAGFLIRMMARWFRTAIQLITFCAKFLEPENWEVGLRGIKQNQEKSRKCKGKSTPTRLDWLQKAWKTSKNPLGSS